jgi:hypothetical protein
MVSSIVVLSLAAQSSGGANPEMLFFARPKFWGLSTNFFDMVAPYSASMVVL